jgi:hypothetical protein
LRKSSYYAFKKYGVKPIAGPFKTRNEAKKHGLRVGHACEYCGRYSGGMTICYGCLLCIFAGETVPSKSVTRHRKLSKTTSTKQVTELFCTC